MTATTWSGTTCGGFGQVVKMIWCGDCASYVNGIAAGQCRFEAEHAADRGRHESSRAEGVPSPASGAPGWGGAAAAPTGEVAADRLDMVVQELRRQYQQSKQREFTAANNARKSTDSSRLFFLDRVSEHQTAALRAAYLLGLAGSELPV